MQGFMDVVATLATPVTKELLEINRTETTVFPSQVLARNPNRGCGYTKIKNCFGVLLLS